MLLRSRTDLYALQETARYHLRDSEQRLGRVETKKNNEKPRPSRNLKKKKKKLCFRQVNCALALGVSLDKTGKVKAAGGFLVQALPLCSEETLTALEKNISSLPAVSSFFLPEGDSKSVSDGGGGGVARLTSALLEGIGAAPGPGFSLAPRYGPCEKEGLRERMVRAAALLGEKEVKAALEANNGVMEMRCEFCQEAVEFEAEEVLEAARRARNGQEAEEG